MKPKYEINISIVPPSCLPTSLDRTQLEDITSVGATWRVYMDPSNGQIHDGAEYYKESKMGIENE